MQSRTQNHPLEPSLCICIGYKKDDSTIMCNINSNFGTRVAGNVSPDAFEDKRMCNRVFELAYTVSPVATVGEGFQIQK